MGISALRQCPSEHESMPLLRSLADSAAHVAINMVLLTELFASPPPPLRRVKDACKVQRPRAQQGPNAERVISFQRLPNFLACCARGRAHSVKANFPRR